MSSIFSRSLPVLIIIFLLSPISDLQVSARWGEKAEASVECLSKTMVYTVNKDGTWTLESDIQLKILTEAGRQALSTQTCTYDATRNTAEVLEASTDNNGTKSIVPKNRIEDKPLASDALGLRKQHQILIPFDRVAVGSILHLKLKEHFFKPDFEKYFSASIGFQGGYLWKKIDVVINSELPLISNINDPRNSLDVRENQDKSKYTLQINLKKPIYEQLFGEPDQFYGEPALYTSIFVSTERGFERLGKLEAAFYQPILSSPLPEELERIRKIASSIKDETDCIDTIVAHLIDKITYLGNWNIAEGHLAPRSLEAIIASGSGDCKEYASCLAAILNKLGQGYNAKIALVERNDVYLEEDVKPAYKRSFDHAIVKVIGPSGKTYWVDPTNNVSMAGGVFPDIADRPTLVLDAENPTYERIPPIDFRHALCKDERTLTITNDGIVNTKGSFHFEGETAKCLTEGLKMHHPSVIKEGIVRQMCGSSDPIDPTVSLPECTSHKVKPLKTIFSYGEKHTMTHTNLGDAFPLLGNWYKAYTSASQTHEGALYVGHPETLIKKRLFKNVSAKNLERLAFSIETPWLNAKRELVVTEEGVVVTETIEKLKTIVSAKDLKSKEFDKLKETLRKYCDGVSIVFSK
ncbi:MAG: DUF3857 and transglutaminase domain-containing protein [Alphaproteobacteria bacterium]|nr:DUF3857 and transglutaminase domain-containing protein [Alphaproteobacteria bacterium]